MPLLINPYGKIVSLDDPEQVKYWLEQPGFRRATPQEEKDYRKEAEKKLLQNEFNKEKGKGIYLATVSVGGKDGYGRASELITRELQNAGVPVTRFYNEQKVAILFHNPYSILRLEAHYRILYTMFESTKIPDDWKPYLDAADKILVPSKFCQEAFKKAGVETEVVPLGYDDEVFKYKQRVDKRKDRKDFVFLHYNAFNVRKGFMEVFNAFVKEFAKDEPVKLVLKTTLNQSPLPITKSQYPNIEIIYGKSTEQQLLDIIYNSDCFVFPSRGEGFGMTPLECMATGIPAIVPNAHGIAEYFNAECMYEAKVGSTCPAIYSRYKGQDVGEMVVCDEKELRKTMRYIYEHQDEAREKGKLAAEYVKQWTFKQTAQRLKEIYEGVIVKPLPERKIKSVLTLEAI